MERRQRRFVEQIDVIVNTVGLRVEALERTTIENAQRRENVILVSSGLLIALIILAAGWQARDLSRVVGGMVSTCERIAAGDLQTRVDDVGDEEFGALARAFNAMTEELSQTTVTREYVAGVLDSMMTAVVVTDAGGTIRSANTAACRMVDRLESGLVGSSVELLFADSSEALAWQRASGPRAATEVQWRMSSGEERPVLLSVGRLAGEHGDNAGKVYAAEDISELVAMRQKLVDSRAELNHSQKLDAIGRLAGGVAHDFNNILTSIIGTGEMMLADLPADAESAREDTKEILDAGRRAARLTSQLLLFARKDAPELRPIAVNEAVIDLEKMLRRVIGEDITLETRLDDAVGAVLSDRGQLQQVLMNLAVNARDAMPEGGRLTISTSLVAGDAVEGGADVGSSNDLRVVLTVSDTGTGMSAEVQEHIFEPFFTTKGRGQGTGLGLSTVYGIIKQVGGAVAVHSVLGEGTSFRISLPASGRPGKRTDISGSHRAVERVAGTTVLVIEDEDMVRRMTCRLLKSRGVTVLEADSGEAAVEVSRQHDGPIDLVLSDVIMPDMHGPEAVEVIRASRPDVPVVFMSGYTGVSMDAVQRVARDGALLQKPFTSDQLIARLARALEAVD